MSEQNLTPEEDELSVEELEEAAGGFADSNSGCNGNCPCSPAVA
jgi:hypothetical protein